MKHLKNKKSIEMSLNLIIMLIIGLTVMGLIISFVTNFLNKADEGIQIGKDDQQKIDSVKREEGNFALLYATLEIAKGEKVKNYLKIRNPTNSDLDIGASNLVTGTGKLKVGITDVSGGNISIIEIFSPPILLGAGDSEGYPIEIRVPSELSTGTYWATFELTAGTEPYKKLLTIEVK